jgi:regulatory protein
MLRSRETTPVVREWAPKAMAVRFLPVPEEGASTLGAQRSDLAEVIELRSKLMKIVPGESAGSAKEPARDVCEDAVRLLARKALSSGELRGELLRSGHDPFEVEDVIDEFFRRLYLNDHDLARALVEKLRDVKRASRSQIKLKLHERALPSAVIEEVISELDDAEEYTILQRVAQDRACKLIGLDRQTAERRLLGFLARRGWSGEAATRAAREALDMTEIGVSCVRFS